MPALVGLWPLALWMYFSRNKGVHSKPRALFTLGNSSDAFLILRAQNAGLSVPGILGMLLCFNLVYSLLSTPAGVLSDRLGRRQVLWVGWLIYVITYLGFAFSNAGWQTWLLMMLYGVYYALVEGVARAYLADLVPAHQRGTAASTLAGILWQGVGGWIGYGPSAPFFFGAGLALCAVVLLWFIPTPDIKAVAKM